MCDENYDDLIISNNSLFYKRVISPCTKQLNGRYDIHTRCFPNQISLRGNGMLFLAFFICQQAVYSLVGL